VSTFADISINMVLGHLLPSVQPQPFLDRTRASFEQSLVEPHTILLEEHLQLALERDVGGGTLVLTLVTKITTVVQRRSHVHIALAREDALQTMTGQFQLSVCSLGKLHRCSEIMSGS
jgi:hypothetical protein